MTMRVAGPASNPLTIGVAQTGPVLSDDPRSMLPAARDMFELAAQAKVQLLLFSELFMSPFFPNRLEQDFDRWFIDVDGEVMRELTGLARSHGIAAVFGFGERSASGYFNSALVCDEQGATLGIYRKTHIPAYFPNAQQGGTGSFEKFYFTPGGALPVFDWRGVRFGIQICNDRLYPEPSRVLAMHGAQMILMPICYSTYSDPTQRASFWEVPLRARAFENGVYVIASNRVGVEGPRHHLGRSMIVDPRGMIIAEAGSEGPELLVTDIDLAAVQRARSGFPWWRDRRPDLYGDLLATDPPA
jgi:N-carbamoylputrescine amidase